MPGFRSLGDEEDVEFECKISDKGLEATSVTGPEGDNCKGSHRRPMSKKRFRKIRCYNCGEFANHIAAKCNLGPQPKRCHNCKSVDHLIADCPIKEEKKGSSAPKTKNGDARSGEVPTQNGSGKTHLRNNHFTEDRDDSDEHRKDFSSSPSYCDSGSSEGKREL